MAGRFEQTLRVRFGHCGPAGIVFYPQILVLFNALVEDWVDEALGLHADLGLVGDVEGIRGRLAQRILLRAPLLRELDALEVGDEVVDLLNEGVAVGGDEDFGPAPDEAHEDLSHHALEAWVEVCFGLFVDQETWSNLPGAKHGDERSKL